MPLAARRQWHLYMLNENVRFNTTKTEEGRAKNRRVELIEQ
jgi:hypothetical protein